MKAVAIGGGPAGLFFALLLKQADPTHEVTVYERNQLDDTFGFGVVFSDATEEALAQADPTIAGVMAAQSHRWDDIEIHYAARSYLDRYGFRAFARGCSRFWANAASRRRMCFQREIVDPEEPERDLVLAADGRTRSCAALARALSAERGHPNVRVVGTRPLPRSRSISSATSMGCGGSTPTSTSPIAPRSSSRRRKTRGARLGSSMPTSPRRSHSASDCSRTSWRAIG
jgi:hypothetical protein